MFRIMSKYTFPLKRPVALLILTGAIATGFFIYNINTLYNKKIPLTARITANNNLSARQTEEPLISGFEFTEYAKGGRKFSIKAEKFFLKNKLVKPFGFRIATGKTAELKGVDVVFYREGKPVSSIYSKAAVMDMRKKDILFEGKPALVTEDKRTLSARTITWNNFERRISAKGNCILGADGKRYLARSIDSDIELKDFAFKGEQTNGYKIKREE